MLVDGTHHRTIRRVEGRPAVAVIDQTRLPGAFEIVTLSSLEDVATAIRTMVVRGAPLIGVSAAYGLAIALARDPSDEAMRAAARTLAETRPTAVNLRWALARMMEAVRDVAPSGRADAAFSVAGRLADEDVETCRAIGEHGAEALRRSIHPSGTRPLRVLTHCNAGWLATVDWGTALSPIYRLFDEGVPISVWVDETRPRNQGLLTMWELSRHGVPCTLIADNAGGHYLQRGEVDACIVGSDRTTRAGDVCNKIGTYLKALAARDSGVPFYAAVPSSTIDFTLEHGAEIPIEERSPRELVGDAAWPAKNPAFDVTPARLVTGIVTERGVAEASAAGLAGLFPAEATGARPR